MHLVTGKAELKEGGPYSKVDTVRSLVLCRPSETRFPTCKPITGGGGGGRFNSSKVAGFRVCVTKKADESLSLGDADRNSIRLL